jgi:hypothetical protein
MQAIKCAFVILFLSLIGLAQGSDLKARSIVNPKGWIFPGSSWILGGHPPTSSKTFIIEGTEIKEDLFDKISMLDEKNVRSSVEIPLWFRQEGETITIGYEPMVTNSIKRYSFKGKPFCYRMIVYPCYDDMGRVHLPEGSSQKGFPGGCVGADYGLLFYDNDEDGRFETMEFGGMSIFGPGTSRWTPHLPKWVPRNSNSKKETK